MLNRTAVAITITKARNEGHYIKVKWSDKTIWHIVCESYSIIEIDR